MLTRNQESVLREKAAIQAAIIYGALNTHDQVWDSDESLSKQLEKENFFEQQVARGLAQLASKKAAEDDLRIREMSL